MEMIGVPPSLTKVSPSLVDLYRPLPHEQLEETTRNFNDQYLETKASRLTRKSVVRTGCVPCLQAAKRCDGSNPACRASSTTSWRCNSDLAWQWHGSWRERRGIHVFFEFATAPEQAGLFQSGFWHRVVLQACSFSKAVYHIGAAIGTLYEHAIKYSRGIHDSRAFAFALQQYDRSIHLLTSRQSASPDVIQTDPSEVLITCILFTCFEAMQGKTQQAMFHALQSRKLLKACEADPKPSYLRLVQPSDVSPIIRRLEMQSKSLQGRDMEPSDTTGEADLPRVGTIYSLEHAHETLLSVYTRLLCFCQDVRLDWNTHSMAAAMHEKHETFVPWLDRWEKSFGLFLFCNSAKLNTNDMQRAKVLKANHLMSSILATTDQGMNTYWDDISRNHEADFKAIVDLSASVLNTFTIVPLGISHSAQFPYLIYGLWVTEPLFFTMSRCDEPEIRRQAAGLLSGMPRTNPMITSIQQRKPSVAPSRSTPSDTATGLSNEQMSADQWISFARNTRLDAAMATYFGRLPLDFIKRPLVYQEHFQSIDGLPSNSIQADLIFES